MERQVAPVADRGPGAVVIPAVFPHAARGLTIRRAARDAHRTACPIDALACSVCRAHAARISEAKAALRRDTSV